MAENAEADQKGTLGGLRYHEFAERTKRQVMAELIKSGRLPKHDMAWLLVSAVETKVVMIEVDFDAPTDDQGRFADMDVQPIVDVLLDLYYEPADG